LISAEALRPNIEELQAWGKKSADRRRGKVWITSIAGMGSSGGVFSGLLNEALRLRDVVDALVFGSAASNSSLKFWDLHAISSIAVVQMPNRILSAL